MALEPDSVSDLDRKDREIRKDGEATARAVSENAPETPVSPQGTPAKLQRTGLLLRQGEDLFSIGMYQQAIHVWTRILFLERGNSSVRKAIERAKQAIAERERQLDAELAAASVLLDRGDIDEASGKVRHVLSVDPRHREGHYLAEQIALVSRRRDPGPGSVVHEAQESSIVAPSKRGLLLRVSRSRASKPHASRTSSLKMAVFVLGAVLVFAAGALYLSLNWESIVSDGAFVTSSLAPGSADRPSAPPPGASELRYYNGARLFAKGRYREALDELRFVARDSVVSEEARSLILRIEERLLRGAPDQQASSEPASPEVSKPN